MARLLGLFTVSTLLSAVYSAMATEPVINCNVSRGGFVPEGQSVTCQCLAPPPVTGPSPSPSPSLWWPGHSSTARLTVTSVRRDHNGTHYTCLLEREGGNATATFTLRVAYGPLNEDTVIHGPALFVTDGTRRMTLTCGARGVYPALVYRWPDSFCNVTTSNCSFTPRPEDDGNEVLCTATNTEAIRTGTGYFTVTLQYPPKSAPQITTNATNKVLSSGDALTCTVEGGKPLVSSVNFSCANLSWSGKTVSGGSKAVTSVIVIDTTELRQTSLACNCSATWNPEPGLYTQRNETVFELEYKAEKNNFSINGRQQLTVTEADRPQASFHCDMLARPAANLTLRKQKNDSVFAVSYDVNTSGDGLERTELRYNISAVRCEDTGVYQCAADNGFGDPVSTNASLNVTCGPRSLNTSEKNETDGEMKIVLVANPVPSVFQYFLSSDETEKVRKIISEVKFQTACRRHRSLLHLSTCTVKAILVPARYLGGFVVSMSNGLGEYNYSFTINDQVLPNSVGGSRVLLGVLEIGLIATTGVILLLLLFSICIFYKKGKERQAKKRRPPGGAFVTTHSRCESVMFDNVAYESSDAFLNHLQTPLHDSPVMFSEQRHSTLNSMTSNVLTQSSNGRTSRPVCGKKNEI